MEERLKERDIIKTTLPAFMEMTEKEVYKVVKLPDGTYKSILIKKD